jgi:hypothetical protein
METRPNERKFRAGTAAIAFCLVMPFTALFLFASNPTNSSERIIRETIGKQLNKDPDRLTDEDSKKVQRLDLTRTDINDISLIVKFTNLKTLILINNPQVSDITVMANLTNLQTLELGGAKISNISPLVNLVKLQKLNLGVVKISDVNLLANLTNLQTLNLVGDSSKIIDIKPISNLINLQTLNISDMSVRDIEPLAKHLAVDTQIFRFRNGFFASLHVTQNDTLRLISYRT